MGAYYLISFTIHEMYFSLGSNESEQDEHRRKRQWKFAVHNCIDDLVKIQISMTSLCHYFLSMCGDETSECMEIFASSTLRQNEMIVPWRVFPLSILDQSSDFCRSTLFKIKYAGLIRMCLTHSRFRRLGSPLWSTLFQPNIWLQGLIT